MPDEWIIEVKHWDCQPCRIVAADARTLSADQGGDEVSITTTIDGVEHTGWARRA